ncbi:hypothetical protein B0H14DRAFT_2608624 [Mycena olivaceomarginata]|nr:hypothetical protein B0H14DRAFT_2608624 [Mycena olivaceomarginata]
MSLFGELQPQLQQQTSNIFAGTTTPTTVATTIWWWTSSTLLSLARPSQKTTSIFGQPNMSQQAPSLLAVPQTPTCPNTAAAYSAVAPTRNTQGAGMGFRNSQQQQQPKPVASRLFANMQQSWLLGEAFSGTPQQQQGQQPASGGLFGTNTATPTWVRQNQQQRPGLFGDAPSSSNIFGGSSTNTNGMPKSAPAFRSSFGLRLSRQQKQQHALRLPGAAQPGQGQGQRQAADVQMQFAQLTARIEGIAVAWNVAGPECQFQVGLYGRPPDTTNNVWVHAVRENLDPGWAGTPGYDGGDLSAPGYGGRAQREGVAIQASVIATVHERWSLPSVEAQSPEGFDDLRQRVNAQGTQAGAYQERMKIDHKFQCGCNYSGRTVSCWHHTKQWIRDSTSLLMPTYHKIFRLSSSMLKQLESGTTWIQLEAI